MQLNIGYYDPSCSNKNETCISTGLEDDVDESMIPQLLGFLSQSIVPVETLRSTLKDAYFGKLSDERIERVISEIDRDKNQKVRVQQDSEFCD